MLACSANAAAALSQERKGMAAAIMDRDAGPNHDEQVNSDVTDE
jgi:hypothetical protein